MQVFIKERQILDWSHPMMVSIRQDVPYGQIKKSTATQSIMGNRHHRPLPFPLQILDPAARAPGAPRKQKQDSLAAIRGSERDCQMLAYQCPKVTGGPPINGFGISPPREWKAKWGIPRVRTGKVGGFALLT